MDCRVKPGNDGNEVAAHSGANGATMTYRIAMAAALVWGVVSPALAQAQNTVPVPGVLAPVPLPPPPTINALQSPNSPPKLDTFGDKVTRCLHFGASQGLQAGARDAYSRACANN
jgi:hypothetical protein